MEKFSFVEGRPRIIKGGGETKLRMLTGKLPECQKIANARGRKAGRR